MANYTYKVEYAKTGRSTCKLKACSNVIAAGDIRIGRCQPSYFHEGSDVSWYHLDCAFKAFLSSKKSSKVPDSVCLIDGFQTLQPDDQEKVAKAVEEFAAARQKPGSTKATKKSTPSKVTTPSSKNVESSGDAPKNKPTLQVTPQTPSKPPQSQKSVKNDQLRLNEIIPPQWYSALAPILLNQEGANDRLSPHAENVLPTREHVFEQIKDIEPSKVKLIVVGPPVQNTSKTASPYTCMSASVKCWGDELSFALSHLIKAVQDYIVNEGLDEQAKLDNYKATPVLDWFEQTKKEGVLWLPSAFTSTTGSKDHDGHTHSLDKYWTPVILKIVKCVFKAKLQSNPNRSGIVIALLGAHLVPIQSMVLKMYYRVSNHFPLRFVIVPDCPSHANKAFVTAEGENPLTVINSLLAETNNDPICWTPKTSTGVSSVKSTMRDEAASQSQIPLEKKLSRFAMLSLDNHKSIDFSKTFGGMSTSTSIELQRSMVDPTNSALPEKIFTFIDATSDSIQIRPLHEPMFHYQHATNHFQQMKRGESYWIHLDDCFTLLSKHYTYRLVLASSLTSTASSPMQKGSVENSAKNKSESLLSKRTSHEVEEDVIDWASAVKPPPAKRTKKNDDDDDEWTPTTFNEEESRGSEPADNGSDSDTEDTRPMCKYGVKCYRKNPEHFKQFRHPHKPGK